MGHLTLDKIAQMYDRPLTASDRSVLRRLIREEMKRLGYDPRLYLDESMNFAPLSKQRRIRQLFRIFMSVAAERPEWHKRRGR